MKICKTLRINFTISLNYGDNRAISLKLDKSYTLPTTAYFGVLNKHPNSIARPTFASGQTKMWVIDKSNGHISMASML